MGGKCFKNKKFDVDYKEKFLLVDQTKCINKKYKSQSKIYFNIIHEQINEFYISNRHKQCFNSFMINKTDYFASTNKKHFIKFVEKNYNWKDYLLKYLKKLEKNNILWASLLIK